MSSGIYRLTFSSGNFYIGKSVNIEGRWLQHEEAFRKGTAARKMQAEYDRSGSPTREVMADCHAEHLDVLEPHFIARMYCPEMLNGTIPLDTMPDIKDIFESGIYYLFQWSTLELMVKLQTLHNGGSAVVVPPVVVPTIIPVVEIEEYDERYEYEDDGVEYDYSKEEHEAWVERTAEAMRRSQPEKQDTLAKTKAAAAALAAIDRKEQLQEAVARRQEKARAEGGLWKWLFG
jgi:hypothetical protein